MKADSYTIGKETLTIEILDSGHIVLKGPDPDGETSGDETNERRGRNTADYAEAFPDTEAGRSDFFDLWEAMAAAATGVSKTSAQDFLDNARS